MNPSKEPTAWSGAITALAVSGIPLLRAFGVNITEDQSNAILGFLAAVILFGSLLLRSKVVSNARAEKAVDAALNIDPNAAQQTPSAKAVLAATKV